MSIFLWSNILAQPTSKRLPRWRCFFLLKCLLLATAATGQTGLLTAEDFFRQIRAQHPVAKQAALLMDEAGAALLSARGGFDPKLFGSWERKSFDAKTYYNLAEGGVKIPTWYGIEGKLAYNYANGVFLNPENNLPADGQAVLGLSMPLLQGLVIDERRADLFQARILRQANEAEQRLMLNDLMFAAAKTYWDWALAHAWLQTLDQAITLAQIRLDGVSESHLQGDLPAIDTVEALLQVQDWTLRRNDAQVSVQNAALAMQDFIWENDVAVPLDTALRPAPLGWLPQWATLLDAPPAELAAQHPEVQFYELKVRQLEVERRLKAEQLKPRLDVSYNLLGNGPWLQDGNLVNSFRENYKWGVSAGFPLLLRKARGNVQLADLKILEVSYGLAQTRQEIRNEIAAYQNDLRNLQQQIQLSLEMRDNYARLLAGENEKFAIGESSLFLVNARENKLIEAELKLLKLQADLMKTEAGLRWAAGNL